MAKLPIRQDIIPAGDAPILTVDTHTTGEPTRIIYSGFPALHGHTLLQKKADAKANHDHIRRRLMLEPRGHREMFGALLVNNTELTASGDADIGVLFMHNEGFSDMCGHATIALGRFLVDFDAEACPGLFPGRNLQLNKKTMTTTVNLHCPCGVVKVTVPVVVGLEGKLQSDPGKSVSFVSVDSYATGLDVDVTLPDASRWSELGERTRITVDFCYGGAFYCVVDAEELGFDSLKSTDLDALRRAAGSLMDALNADPQYRQFFQHPTEPDLGCLLGVIIRDTSRGVIPDGVDGAELGLCIFGDQQQVDRSPCGSGSAARRTIGHTKYNWPMEKKQVYHSLVSEASGRGGFTAYVVERSQDQGDASDVAGERVRVRVEGQAFYTGFSTFVVESADRISGSGFML
ncbi:hypothetical protein B0T16DRAFT_406195 [Cercophora newfieldiana]|uniref:trans-L-3-hydroxyproline dehydratase n=1 Tax=Cercophora newfieldiana TaxID=92897 RepID=A0AA39YK29_9PEZI|nr:hypothetical protein B0T16DRAFT_406195 [Cercophora newfieldiana]